MEAVAAVGVAAAAVQFFAFSAEAIKLCLEVRDHADGATRRNDEISKAVAELRDLRSQLQKSFKPKSANDRKIQGLAIDCAIEANNLLDLLKSLQKLGKTGWTGDVRATLKAMRNTKKIERQRDALEQKQKVLDSALTQEIWTHVISDSAAQSAQLQILRTYITRLRQDASEQNALSASRHDQVTQQISQSTGENRDLHGVTHNLITNQGQAINAQHIQISQATEESRGLHGATRKLIVDQGNVLTAQQKHRDLLESLHFPAMYSRQESLKTPQGETYEWIFEKAEQPSWRDSESDRCKESQDHKGKDFRGWLESDSGLYWISGKAGSGKSTLMGHITGDRRLRKHLQVWAGNKPLRVLTFFFWRASRNTMQQSVQGLLRTLLHQLLSDAEDIAVTVYDTFTRGQNLAWTKKTLLDTLELVLQETTPLCNLAVFMDGLDEYEGSPSDVLNMVHQLISWPSIKACVSSRPEVHIRDELNVHPHLKMEECNFDDIYEFAKNKLAVCSPSDSATEYYSREIASNSAGVFLWATLVVQDLVSGIKAGDDEKMLDQRLEDTPPEIDALIRQIFDGVDRLHKQSLAFYLDSLEYYIHSSDQEYPYDLRQAPLINLAAASFEGQLASYELFSKHCAKVERQISARSRGLLEVVDGCRYQGLIPFDVHSDMFALSQLSQEARFQNATLRQLAATRTSHHEQTQSTECLRQHMVKHVVYLHRSVYDLAATLHGDSPSKTEVSKEQNIKKLLIGHMKLYVVLPNNSAYQSRFAYERPLRTQMLKYFHRAESYLPQHVIFELIDSYREACLGFEIRDICEPYEADALKNRNLVEWASWIHCIGAGLLEYAQPWVVELPDPIVLILAIREINTSRFASGDQYFTALELLVSLLERLFAGWRIRWQQERRQIRSMHLYYAQSGETVSWGRNLGLSASDNERYIHHVGVYLASEQQLHSCIILDSAKTYENIGGGLQRPGASDTLGYPSERLVQLLDRGNRLWAEIDMHTSLDPVQWGRNYDGCMSCVLQWPCQSVAHFLGPCDTCKSELELCQGARGSLDHSLRLICGPFNTGLRSWDRHEHIYYDLSLEILKWIPYLHRGWETREGAEKIHAKQDPNVLWSFWFEEPGLWEAFVDDIWANHRNQLDATQQLLVLACLRDACRIGQRLRQDQRAESITNRYFDRDQWTERLEK